MYCKDMRTTISSKGQITVPARVRDALGLVSGTKIELDIGPDGTFIGRKVEESSFYSRFQGIGKNAAVPWSDGGEAMETLRGPVETGDVDPAQ